MRIASFNQISVNFFYEIFICFYRTPLHVAAENGRAEIVKLLLTHKDIDVNMKRISFHFFHIILYYFFLMSFQYKVFNEIS